MDYRFLFEKALETSKNAWCVYSDFPVGAALLLYRQFPNNSPSIPIPIH